MRNNTFTQRSDRRGASAIEFVLWLPVLIILLSGVVDISWYMSRYHLVQRATMDGVRYGVRQAAEEAPTDAQGSKQIPAAENRARAMLVDFGLGSPVVNAQLIPDGGGCPFDRLEMDTTVTFQPLIGFITLPNTISSNFSMMSEIQR
jgi:hypothetical protein